MKDLSEASGIKYDTIRNWKTRNILPDVIQAKSLADALGFSINELFFGTEKQTAEFDEVRIMHNLKRKAPDLYDHVISFYA